jgi:hypothetical protein
VGEYSSGAGGLTASISILDTGVAQMRLRYASGVVDYRLTCIGPALWQAVSSLMMPLGATLEIAAGGFQLTTGRTTRLHFRRIK